MSSRHDPLGTPYPSGGSARSTERGWALFAVLVVTVFLFAALAIASMILVERMGEVRRTANDLRLQTMVDSGVAVALARWQANASYRGSETLRLEDGLVEVEVAPGNTTLRRVARVRAERAGRQRSVTARLSRASTADPPRVDSWDEGSALQQGPPIIPPPDEQ